MRFGMHESSTTSPTTATRPTSSARPRPRPRAQLFRGDRPRIDCAVRQIVARAFEAEQRDPRLHGGPSSKSARDLLRPRDPRRGGSQGHPRPGDGRPAGHAWPSSSPSAGALVIGGRRSLGACQQSRKHAPLPINISPSSRRNCHAPFPPARPRPPRHRHARRPAGHRPEVSHPQKRSRTAAPSPSVTGNPRSPSPTTTTSSRWSATAMS